MGWELLSNRMLVVKLLLQKKGLLDEFIIITTSYPLQISIDLQCSGIQTIKTVQKTSLEMSTLDLVGIPEGVFCY